MIILIWGELLTKSRNINVYYLCPKKKIILGAFSIKVFEV